MAEPEVAEELKTETQEQEEKEEIQLPEAATLLGTAIESPKPILKTIWKYNVQPPIITTAAGALLIANPALAVAVLPALGVGAKIGKRLNDVQENLQWKVAPYVAPAQVIESKYKMAWRKALWAIPKALLYRNFTLDTPTGQRYKYKDFWPTAILGQGVSKFLLSKAGGREDSVFKKAADNLKPYYWNRKEGVKKNEKRRGLWGVIVGLFVVDLIGTAVVRVLKNVAVRVLKTTNAGRTILKAVGSERVQVGSRVAGHGVNAVFSLNTVAGGAIGFVATGGNPIGVAIGTFAGWGNQFYLNLEKDLYLRNKFLEVQVGKQVGEFAVPGGPEVAEIKVLGPPSKIGRFAANAYRPAAFFAKHGLLRIPLKGFAVGFVLTGGNPLVGLEFAVGQWIWSSRAIFAAGALRLTYGVLNRTGWVRGFTQSEWLAGKQVGNVYKVHWTRNLVASNRGGLVGSAITLPFVVVGIAPVWLPFAAYGAGMGINFTFRAFKNRFFPAKVGGPLRTAESFLTKMGRRFPYWKGAGVGLGVAAILVGLGVPVWIALPASVAGGVGVEYFLRKYLFTGRTGSTFAEQTAGLSLREIYLQFGLRGAARFLLPKLIIPFLGGLDLLRWGLNWAIYSGGLQQVAGALLAATGATATIAAALSFFGIGLPLWAVVAIVGSLAGLFYLLAKYGKPFLKALLWALNKFFYPFDLALDKLFDYVIIPGLGYGLSGLYKILAFTLNIPVLGLGWWLTRLPFGIGNFFENVGDFFKGLFGGAKDVAKGLVGVLTGLVGAVISLLTGGDIAEAAFMAAIGLILAGVVITAALEPEPGLGPINLIKTATPNHIENDAVNRTVEFKITIEAPDRKITNITCTDTLTNVLETRDISIPCPDRLEAGEKFEHTFTYDIPANSALNDTVVKNTITVSGNAQTAPFDIPRCEGVPPASDGNPTNGIETSLEELQCYIIQKARGKTEPHTRLPLEQVMLTVMNGESGGNQCSSNNTAGAVGVFQFIASTWKGNTDPAQHNLDSGSVHAGSVTPELGENGCWGNPGEDPDVIGEHDGDPDFEWALLFGPNLDGDAWNPFHQIDVAVTMMESGGACNWEAFWRNFGGC